MDSTQEAMELLVTHGFLAKTTSEGGGVTYNTSSEEQRKMLSAILRHPTMWDESPILKSCRPALEVLRQSEIFHEE